MCISGCYTCWRINHWSVGDSVSHFCLCKNFPPDLFKDIFSGHRILWYFHSFITLKMPFYHCLETSNVVAWFHTLIGQVSRKLTIWPTHSKLAEFQLKACFLLCGKSCFPQAPRVLPHVHSAGVLWGFEESLWSRMETSPSVASSFPGFLPQFPLFSWAWTLSLTLQGIKTVAFFMSSRCAVQGDGHAWGKGPLNMSEEGLLFSRAV